MSEENMNQSKKAPMPWMGLAVLLAVLIVGGVLFRDKLFPSGVGKMAQEQTSDSSKYQAVFLTNGQVYFGKLSQPNSMYATLTDIYYLQVTQPSIQGPQDANTQNQQKQQAQISLVKLGNELHGPQDEMIINRDHIMFYEDLKEDGKVVQTIREYQKNPPKQETK